MRLDELREEKEVTKTAIAEMLGISDSVYDRWENGKEIIPTRRIYQLANYYEVNIDYLLGLTNERIGLKSDEDIDVFLVSKRLKEIRNDYNESLREFVKRINTSSSTWSAYETGKNLILCAFLIEICQKSNYSVDWVLGRSNTKFRSKND